MNQYQIPAEAIQRGIIDPEYHARLIADINRHARTAGIPPKFIVSKLSDFCTPPEIEWVRNLNLGKDNGMVYVGKIPTPAHRTSAVAMEDKMSAIAGACLRNFTSAQVMSVQEVLALLKTDDMPTPTVLLIPNFCLDQGSGGTLPAWQISSLLGMLYSRLSKNLQTVLYVSSEKALVTSYGEPFWTHITAHYFRP